MYLALKADSFEELLRKRVIKNTTKHKMFLTSGGGGCNGMDVEIEHLT